jgi:hypothetical protein
LRPEDKKKMNKRLEKMKVRSEVWSAVFIRVRLQALLAKL